MAETRAVTEVDGEGTVTLREEPVPDPESGAVLIDVAASVISPGTEGGIVRRRREDPDPSAGSHQLGYQNAGTVIEAPGTERFQPGDRVAAMGSGYAAHSDYTVVPSNLCVHLPEEISFEEGAFNSLAATALHGLRRAELEIGEHVAVFGLGIVGQFVAQLSQAAGCHVLGIDYLENRVDIADDVGVHRPVWAEEEDPVAASESFSREYGVDCGFICFGGDANSALEEMTEMATQVPDGHENGRVVVIGGAEITQRFPVPLGNLDIRASSRTGPGYKDSAWEHGEDYPRTLVRWTTRRHLEEVLRYRIQDRLAIEPLITHRFPLSQVDDAYDTVVESPDEAVGVVIEP